MSYNKTRYTRQPLSMSLVGCCARGVVGRGVRRALPIKPRSPSFYSTDEYIVARANESKLDLN